MVWVSKSAILNDKIGENGENSKRSSLDQDLDGEKLYGVKNYPQKAMKEKGTNDDAKKHIKVCIIALKALQTDRELPNIV